MVPLRQEPEFGCLLQEKRRAADLSQRKLARQSGLTTRRIVVLESGVELPDDRELGALARACQVSVFDLLPPGYSLRVFAPEAEGPAHVVRGSDALDVLLREYLAMVVELRAGRTVTVPTLRHEDLVELSAALGDTVESVEARLIALLDADVVHVPVMETLTPRANLDV